MSITDRYNYNAIDFANYGADIKEEALIKDARAILGLAAEYDLTAAQLSWAADNSPDFHVLRLMVLAMCEGKDSND